jgi:energy-coupling factor transporter ATP-binding protein EcfA2
MRIDYRLERPVPLQARLHLRGFTVLVGLSGEGKSSLLKDIAGLLPARGSPFDILPPQRRPVGCLPQGYGLFPHLRAWENVAFPLPRGRNRRNRAIHLLTRVGIIRYIAVNIRGEQLNEPNADCLSRSYPAGMAHVGNGPRLCLDDRRNRRIDRSGRRRIPAANPGRSGRLRCAPRRPDDQLLSLATLITALVVRWRTDSLVDVGEFVPAAIALSLGGVTSAYFSARLISKISNHGLERVIAVLLIAIGLLLIGERLLPGGLSALVPPAAVCQVPVGVRSACASAASRHFWASPAANCLFRR